MKVERRQGSDERRILIAMVVDEVVLARISKVWKRGLFQSSWSDLIGGWCVDFWERYGKPPRESIQGLFQSWASEDRDEDTVKLVQRFLDGLSGEYESSVEESNSEYVIDCAGKHFETVWLRRLAAEIEGDLDSGDVEKASTRVASHGRIELGAGTTIDVLTNKEAIQKAFESKQEGLIMFPGALGQFYGNHLEREGFIAFMGGEKKGKSWKLIDLAWRGMLQRRRVAFFEVGDSSQDQIMKRFMIRAARRPAWAGTVSCPTGIERESGARFATVFTESRHFPEPLDWKVAWTACERIMQRKVRSKESLLKLSCHPNSTLSVAGIRSIIQDWEREGWFPDAVVIDYADILAPPPGVQEHREQINESWKQMRAMSQSLHCLVVTATQADAKSYKGDLLRLSNFSEDKRKYGHVTGMIGINVTDIEKENGISRLNWLVLREAEFTENRCVHVAGCLSIGDPCIYSTF